MRKKSPYDGPLRRCPSSCPNRADYTDEEREFLTAMDRYKRLRRRPHPTWREVLAVLKSLGFRRVAPADEELP